MIPFERYPQSDHLPLEGGGNRKMLFSDSFTKVTSSLGSGGLPVQVQVLLPAPDNDNPNPVPIGDGFGFLVYLEC